MRERRLACLLFALTLTTIYEETSKSYLTMKGLEVGFARVDQLPGAGIEPLQNVLFNRRQINNKVKTNRKKKTKRINKLCLLVLKNKLEVENNGHPDIIKPRRAERQLVYCCNLAGSMSHIP